MNLAYSKYGMLSVLPICWAVSSPQNLSRFFLRMNIPNHKGPDSVHQYFGFELSFAAEKSKKSTHATCSGARYSILIMKRPDSRVSVILAR